MSRIVTGLLSGILLMVAACAPAPQADVNYDPLERMNRGVFAFNEVVDNLILDPLVTGYRFVTTDGMRRGVRNAFSNLGEPVTFVSSILQGDFEHAMVSLWRFTLNSTFGLGGIRDFAGTHSPELKARREDYGQAFASWGVPAGPYIVAPFIGGTNLRDIVGSVLDSIAHPLFVDSGIHDDELLALAIAEGFTVRDQLDALVDDTYDNALDPYTAFRSIRIQRRNAQIRNVGSRQ